jgi:hypothetical protein
MFLFALTLSPEGRLHLHGALSWCDLPATPPLHPKYHLHHVAAMAEQDPYFKRFHECEELCTQEKYTECTKLALDNLKDYTMPRYFLIKTLLLLVGAENDDWHKAEVCHYRLLATTFLNLLNEINRLTESVPKRSIAPPNSA